MLTKCEQGRHEEVSLFPSLALQNFMGRAEIILPEISRLDRKIGAQMGKPCRILGASLNAINIAAREIRSKTPMPWTDNTVASGPASEKVCTAYAMHSHPLLVVNAHWKEMLLLRCGRSILVAVFSPPAAEECRPRRFLSHPLQVS